MTLNESANPSVHDNNVYAYVVRCTQRQIVLHTEYRHASAEEYTDLIFSGVAGHYFEDVLEGNILFGIDEVEVQRIITGWSNLFASRKNYGWPDGIRYDDENELAAILRTRALKGYEIYSSYGLGGWVLAAGMDLTPRTARADP